MAEAFPLSWPQGRPRKTARRSAQFGTTKRAGSKSALTINEAVARLQGELDRLGARHTVLSSNLEPRLDGLPRSGQREPADPGVAVYFQLAGKPHCMPCDTFNKVADNIAAVAAHIEATRKIERYGVSSVAEMFTGFAALPAPGGRRHWREVLALSNVPVMNISGATIQNAFRHLASKHHPDKPGGTHDAMSELTRARDEALKEIGNG